MNLNKFELTYFDNFQYILVTKQAVVYDTPVKGAKTKDNVNCFIDMDVVFRIMGDSDKGEDPALVQKFVHEVTPR